MTLPKFLQAQKKRRARRNRLAQIDLPYRPLLGAWLIQIALMLDWLGQRDGEHWPDLLRDDDFMLLTGLSELPEFQARQCPSLTQCRTALNRRLAELKAEPLPDDLPLFGNLQLLAGLLQLNEAEHAILLFSALLKLFDVFRSVVAGRSVRTPDQLLWRLLGGLTGLPEQDLRSAASFDSVLVQSGVIKVKAVVDLEDKLDLMEALQGVLLTPHDSLEELMRRFLQPASAPSLTLGNFPHLDGDTAILLPYLANALAARTGGVNILVSGKPGVGKTEYATALAKALGVELYQVACDEPSGGRVVGGESRLRSYTFCQHLLARSANALLMFDEIEDVFPAEFDVAALLFGAGAGGAGKQVGGKAWINRTLEQNPVPAIWVSNRTNQIDHAYLRRFDYSVSFPVPPRSVRLTIARHHLAGFAASEEWLERIAGHEDLAPAQLERAAKVAGIAAGNEPALARQVVEQTLDRSVTLLGQTPLRGHSGARMAYDLRWLNTDVEIPRLVAGLRSHGKGSFCFFGAPGTGKSELARHMGDALDLQVVVRRASDLMDMYVGGTEKNIAAMFAAARQQDALLVLDEVDSFLADRRRAHQSWEVTQVNELLTQMEAFEGIFICTTNLMEHLDQACLRRFSFKIRFNPLTPDQRWGFFRQEVLRLGAGPADADRWEREVRRLEGLTPGDFNVAARQFELWGESPSSERLYEQLSRECRAKCGSAVKVGF